VALIHSVFQRYTFVDFATQAYSALVASAIILFHNVTVAHWPWLVAAHAVGILTVHWLIEGSHWLWRMHPTQVSSGAPLSPALSPAEKASVGSFSKIQFRDQDASAERCLTSSRGSCGYAGRFRGVASALYFLRHFYPVLLYIWFYSETGWLNRMFFNTYLDPVVIRCDQALFGCQPSILWMQKMPYLAVSEIFYAAYFSYYLMIFGIGLALYLRSRRQFFHYISVVSFVFYICYVFYIVVPVIGPVTLLHMVPGYNLPPEIQALAPDASYPESVRSGVFYHVMEWIYAVFEAPGAAIPSSHVAIALCIVFFCFRYLRPVRYALLIAAILLCLSTIYCRYHYATDVLAGIATAAALVPLGNRLYLKLEKHDLVQETAVENSDVGRA
jgi:membrane-associated phospholipid phosphatase